MAPRWNTHAAGSIDLTSDPDDEPGPLDALFSPQKPRPKKMPVPLPANARHLHPSSTAQRQHTMVPLPGSQYSSGSSSNTPLPNSITKISPYASPYNMATISNATATNGTPNGTSYVPVCTAAQNRSANGFANPQPEKRRKVSIPADSRPVSASSENEKHAPAKPAKTKFYGVQVGHVPGVYTDWKAVLAQITGCKGSTQMAFSTREEAQAFVDGRQKLFPRSLAPLPVMPENARPIPATPSIPNLVPDRAPAIPHSSASSSSMPAARLHANKMPSVQSLNVALKINDTGTLFAEEEPVSQPCRELHLGRISDATQDSESNNFASRGLAIAQTSATEMVVDQEVPFGKSAVSRSPLGERTASTGSPIHFQPHGGQRNLPTTGNQPKPTLKNSTYDTTLSKQSPRGAVASVENSILGDWSNARETASSSDRTNGYPKKPAPTNVQSPYIPRQDDRDSVISDAGTYDANKPPPVVNPTSNLPAPYNVPATVGPSSQPKKHTGGFSDGERDLLIFLKEVKRFTWSEITATFTTHYPGRSYGTLQTHYSQKLNRRDRSKDPPTLNLPPCFASEARVDWVAAQAEHAGPVYNQRNKRETTNLGEQPPVRPRRSVPSTRPAAGVLPKEFSPGTEFSSQRKRPRRAVPEKNYTWPKRCAPTTEGAVDDGEYDMQSPTDDVHAKSESPEELAPAPDKAIAVDNEPILADFDQENAILAIAAHNKKPISRTQSLPYLTLIQRTSLQNVPTDWEWDQLCSRDWQGTLIHVDFSSTELDLVERVITRILNPLHVSRSRSQRNRIRKLLSGITEPDLLRIASELRSKIHARGRRSIDAFLRDAQDGKIRSAAPRVTRLGASRPNRTYSTEAKFSASSMVRQRELGTQSHRGWSAASRPLTYQMKNKVQDSLGPACSYTGASSDVHAIAWSVDGQCFAAGAICVDDPHSMQYNRPNNLLYGDVSYNTINELGQHYIVRPKPESGPNSTHAMYASQDPKLFKTVSSVAFSPNGRLMFSGGYDHSVSVWETRYDGSQPTEIIAFKHKAEVDMLAVNHTGLLATATRKGSANAVKVMNIQEDNPMQRPDTISFSSDKAASRPDLSILPTALQFSPRFENLLLAGFGANLRQDGRDMSGDICLWDINGCKQLNIWGAGKNVLDLSFHQKQRWFAVGCVAGQNVNRGTRSIVRIYSEQDMDDKYSARMELECRALDMNDVVWCPGNDFLVAAGCTSGRAYVWDVRMPDQFLRELAHGRSLMPLDDYIDREITDTGIRFLTWGDNATRLYTGSSDGVVKVWNVVRSEEDTFVKDLVTLDSGIMSGALSPDRSRLLLGEVNGSVNVLEVGRDDCSIKEAEKMRFIPYEGRDDDDGFDYMQHPNSTDATADSGIACANQLLETGQMAHIPMGGLPIRQAVQGPTYAGPFDAGVDAPFLREQALEFQYKLSQAPSSPCTIPQCRDSVIKITSEETGDSGRSTDRIPDELRQQWKAIGSDLKPIQGKSHCLACGRAARPSVADDGLTLCERCSFACFRCGAANKIAPDTETLHCVQCKRVWDIGVLGYECVKESTSHADLSDVPAPKGYGKDLFMAKMEKEDDASFGDEMNALTDYYFSLAIDRPESPPL